MFEKGDVFCMKLSSASNDFFCCYISEGSSFSIKYSVTFIEPIRRKELERAANDAMRLFPEFAVRPVVRNNRIEMIGNDAELVFCDEPGAVKYYGSEDTNGYNLYFVCEDKKLTAFYYHGLSDTSGFTEYLQSVLTLYAAYIGTPVSDRAFLSTVRTPDNPMFNPNEEDRIDPYRLYGNAAAVPEWSFENPGAYTIPSDAPYPPEENRVHELHVDIGTSAFIALSKKLGASFTPLMIDVAAQTVYRNYDTGGDPFIAMLPVNLRPLFGSETAVNFSDGVSVPSYSETDMPDVAARCARMKDVMKKQITKASFSRILGEKAAAVDRYFADESDILTRKRPVPAGGKPPYTLPVTYPGKLTFGAPLDELLEDAFVTGYSRVNSIICYTFGEKMEFVFMWRSDDITYIRQFAETLRRLGFTPKLTDLGLVKRDLFSVKKLMVK